MGVQISQGQGAISEGCPPHWKGMGDFAAMYAKRLNRSRCRLRVQVGPRNHILDEVKVGRVHSLSRGVIRRRCGLSSKFFAHLLLLLLLLLYYYYIIIIIVIIIVIIIIILIKVSKNKNSDHDGVSHGVRCSQEGERIPPLESNG